MKNTLIIYRTKLNLTQGQMAELLGVHRVKYNTWENQHEQPNLIRMYQIWKTLKIKFADLNMQDLLSDE